MGRPVLRAGVVGLAGIAVLTVAGCTGGSDATTGDSTAMTPAGPSGSTSGPAPTSSGVTAPGTGGTAPSATNQPTTPSGTGSVSGPAVPAVPTVPAGAAGAYTLVVTGGGTVTTPVPTVSCGQDGSLTAGGLSLTPGGASLHFSDVPPVGTLTVPGTAELSAAGGVFRGSTPTTAVTFSWTC